MEAPTEPIRPEEVAVANLINESANWSKAQLTGERIMRMKKIDSILDDLNRLRAKGTVIPWPVLLSKES